MKTNFPDATDLLNFTLTITPDEGVYRISQSVLNVNAMNLLLIQACTRVAHFSSLSSSTPTTRTTLPR